MRTTLDQAGRIELPDVVQAELGVKAGDEVLLENQGGHWVITAARGSGGLCWRGNVLVHEGVSPEPVDEVLGQVREERDLDQGEGILPRRAGNCKGMLTILADDDKHLKDFAEYMG